MRQLLISAEDYKEQYEEDYGAQGHGRLQENVYYEASS